jgi:hypothetical protein
LKFPLENQRIINVFITHRDYEWIGENQNWLGENDGQNRRRFNSKTKWYFITKVPIEKV